MNNLRRKPTFNELINYLYPDRRATFIRNSHYLSQFDGNLFDIEEQQKDITKEQIKELLQKTQNTAALVSDASQEQNRRTTEQATRRSVSAGPTIGREPQTDAGTTQSVAPLMFDMAVDDIADAAMEEADAVMEAAREAEERKNQNATGIVSKHLGEEVKDLPYIQQSAASSSNLNPKPPKPARSRTRSPGRPPKTSPEIPAESGASGGTGIKTQKVVREDTGGETLNDEGEQGAQYPLIV